LITEGNNIFNIQRGRVFEVTPNKEIVWEHQMPTGLLIYRSYRIPPEWVPGNPKDYPFWEEDYQDIQSTPQSSPSSGGTQEQSLPSGLLINR
jgi:hypothetical protein